MSEQAAVRSSVAFEHRLALSVEAQRAVRVMMRKSPETQRTYTGVYDRFAGWLADREAVGEAPVSAFSSEAFVTYLERLEERCLPSTVKKERAALRKLARYLHQLGLIDATVILMVEIPTVSELAPARRGLERSSWEAVLTVARARLAGSARARCSLQSAARDLALIQILGGAGLRSHEARALPVDPFDTGRSDNHGGSVYLRVHGKGNKVRPVPLYGDVSDALERWRELRDQIPELAGDPYLFPQLGRRRRDGSFPDAGGQLSTTALIRIVRPDHACRGGAGRAGSPAHAQTHLRPALHGRATSRALAASADHGSRFSGDDKPLRPPR